MDIPCLSLIFWVVKMLKQSSKINNAQLFCLGQEMHTDRANKEALFQYLEIPQGFVSIYFCLLRTILTGV